MKTATLDGNAVVEAAFKAFEEWRVKRDPEGEMTIQEQAEAYYCEWLANQQSRSDA